MTRSLLEEFLADPGRARFAGAAPVVSWREDDDAEWDAALRDARATAIDLRRRGRAHGRVALVTGAHGGRAPRASQAAHLFRRAHPIAMPGALSGRLAAWRNEIHAARVRAEPLAAPEGLERWLAGALAKSRRFSAGERLELVDPTRDIARSAIVDARGGALAPWVKCARLSTHAADASLRLRFGAGAEVDDDALDDEGAARALAALALETCPEVGIVDEARDVWSYVAAAAGESLFPTAAIVYWNAPEGGARMHHDAFRDDDSHGQRGVLYAQLAGRTCWIALSSADLARRLVEFADLTRAGEFAWLRGESQALDGALDALDQLAERPSELAAEIASPDQGRLGPLIDRGPEFTLFLVDSGHATVLGPGDVLLLPNHGLRRTALHSVFCASDTRTVALSFGLRAGSRSRGRSSTRAADAGNPTRGA